MISGQYSTHIVEYISSSMLCVYDNLESVIIPEGRNAACRSGPVAHLLII